MSRGSDRRYLVHTGDTTYYFEHGRLYSQSYLNQVFKKRINHVELFPGLVLRDGAGNLFKPELQVVLVPVEPEELYEAHPAT
jgi:hypothetical protein